MSAYKILASIFLGTAVVACARLEPPRPTTAQSSSSGAIQGQVKDRDTGESVVGVTVVAHSGPGKGAATVITDENGWYKIVDLPPGEYQVTFYFADLEVCRTGVVVSPERTTPIYQRLSMADAGERIVITDSAPTIDPTSTSQGISLDRDFAKNAPPRRGSAFSGSSSLEKQHYTEPGGRPDHFARYAANPWVGTSDDAVSTFAADVDTASYTIVRRWLDDGKVPPPEAVRVEEFVNYFGYAYAAPVQGPFSVTLDAAPSPFGRAHIVRVGINTQPKEVHERRPLNLVFLVDVSGSMSSPDKLGLARRSLRILVNNLRPDDWISLVTYAGATRVVLPPRQLQDKRAILAAVEDLTSGGSTAMASGIVLAYEQAALHAGPEHVSRVIVLSDGDANVGAISHEEILALIASHVRQDITLSTIGFGVGNYQDATMEQLANKGNGNNYYIDGISQARRVFEEQLGATLEVVAKDVKLQVEFDRTQVQRYRLIGYENRDIADEDFRDDSVDAGEIGAGHQVTALYEVMLTDAVVERERPVLTLRIRHKAPTGVQAIESEWVLPRSKVNTDFTSSHPSFRFAFAVAAFADRLRRAETSRGWSLDAIQQIAAAAAATEERKELVALIKRAIQLGSK